jgi:hypothetical protein
MNVGTPNFWSLHRQELSHSRHAIGKVLVQSSGNKGKMGQGWQ